MKYRHKKKEKHVSEKIIGLNPSPTLGQVLKETLYTNYSWKDIVQNYSTYNLK